MATIDLINAIGLFADRPVSLAATQGGYEYYSSDTQQLFRWNGGTLAWDEIITNSGAGITEGAGDARYLQQSNDLSDVASPSTARTNLGLGSAATKGVGTTSSDVAAGNDSRITGAAQKSSNLSDLASASTARTNLGLDTAATHPDSDYEHVANKGAAGGYAGLDGSGKVPTSQLPSGIAGGLNWLGTWNANTNSPSLTSGTGTNGDTYKVATAGATNLDGITDWKVGDILIYSGTAWQKIDQTESVSSVAGRTGAVTIANTDVSGLGTASTHPATDFAQTANNLSDLANASTARGNLGLGTAATHAAMDFDAAGAAAAVEGLPLGLTGATSATRYVGATTSGAPVSGTFAVGDFIIDRTGKIWVCTTLGSPGTWAQIGGGAGGTGVVNVKDYGAIGDGTTNDYSAINTAIATGLTVFFPPAVYAIGTGLTVSTAGQVLTGYGATLKKTANVDGITVSADRCKVLGLYINGNSNTGAGIVVTANRVLVRDVSARSNANGIVVYGAGSVPGADLNVLEGCEAYGNTVNGFYLHNATDLMMNGCVSQTNQWNGVLLESQSYSLTMVNCHIDDNNVGSHSANNVTVSQADALRITGCVITNCEHGGHGVNLDPTAANQSGFNISDSIVAQNGGYGIVVGAAAGHTSGRAIISGNRMNGNTSGTVQIQTGCSTCILVGNDFAGSAPSDSGTGTILIGNDTGNTGALTVEEADGSPTGTASKLVLPNGTLSFSGSVATYTPSGGSGLTVEEGDGSPTGSPTKIVFPNGTLSYVGSVVTYTPTTAGLGFFQQSINTISWNLLTGSESTSVSETDQTRFSTNTANTIEWAQTFNLPAGSYKITGPFGFGANFGILRVLLNGTQAVSNDRYTSAADTYPSVDLDLGAWGGGTVVIAFICSTKNGSASGKQLVLRGLRLWQYA